MFKIEQRISQININKLYKIKSSLFFIRFIKSKRLIMNNIALNIERKIEIYSSKLCENYTFFIEKYRS